MRKVVVYTLLSIDGVAESPDQFLFDFDDEMHANLAKVLETQDAVLLGRCTYDEWAAYWPTADHEPFASFINNTHKYVATSTPLMTPWVNSSSIEGDAAEFVRDLKEEHGGDIGVHGSIQLARSLFAVGLVDELRLVIAPAAIGQGRGLLGGEPGLRRLTLLRAAATSSGALLVDYAVDSGAHPAIA